MPRSASLSSRGHPISKGPSEGDRKLIQLALSGDQGAFESLKEFYERYVYGLVLHTLDWPDEKGDVQDVLQDIWLQLHKSLGTFEGRSGFGTWLSTIAKNKCRDYLRKKKVRKILVSVSTFGDDEVRDHEKSFVKHPVSDWNGYVEQVRPITDKVFSELFPSEATVVNAFLVDGLRRREISIKYEIPFKDVCGILNKFKSKCRKMRIEGLTRADQMRVPGKAKRRKRSTAVVIESGDLD